MSNARHELENYVTICRNDSPARYGRRELSHGKIDAKDRRAGILTAQRLTLGIRRFVYICYLLIGSVQFLNLYKIILIKIEKISTSTPISSSYFFKCAKFF